jgi:hypothetical protein
MSELTKKELEDLKELLRTATAGPWKSMVEGRDHDSGESFIMTGEGKTRGEDIYLTGATQADQDFIARARNDMSRLIAEIEKLRARLRGPAAAE